MISRRTVLRLGVAQLVSWGISYYLIGAVGEFIRTDLGWSREIVYGGFSVALVSMGCASPVAGRLIDRYGGRRIMMGGSWLCALGCVLLASAHSLPVYYTAWLCLGIAMRLTLYEPRSPRWPVSAGPRRDGRWRISRCWAGWHPPSSGRSGMFWRNGAAGVWRC